MKHCRTSQMQATVIEGPTAHRPGKMRRTTSTRPKRGACQCSVGKHATLVPPTSDLGPVRSNDSLIRFSTMKAIDSRFFFIGTVMLAVACASVQLYFVPDSTAEDAQRTLLRYDEVVAGIAAKILARAGEGE